MIRRVLVLALVVGATGCAWLSSGPPSLEARERKRTPGDATTAWGYYGVTPESPNGKRLCYARFPGPIDLTRNVKYAIYPAELWVCLADGTGHRKLFEGTESVHNGLQQSWINDTHIVFVSGGATYVVNADTGIVEFGPYEGFHPAHHGRDGKILLYRHRDSPAQDGIHQLDVTTGEMNLVLPYEGTVNHLQVSPDGRRVLFTTRGNRFLVVASLDGSSLQVLPGKKPMHFQWFDNDSLFGYTENLVVGFDPDLHHIHEMYRWNLQGKIVEHLAGHGCHGAGRPDRGVFSGESWYVSDPISLFLYARGGREPLAKVFTHRFLHLTWRNGGRHHVNPSFSRDGMRLYYNRAVRENVSHAYSCDLTGVVSPPGGNGGKK